MLRTVGKKVGKTFINYVFDLQKLICLIQNQYETSTRFWFFGLHFSIDMNSLREKH
jgi:hypothetical protein